MAWCTSFSTLIKRFANFRACLLGRRFDLAVPPRNSCTAAATCMICARLVLDLVRVAGPSGVPFRAGIGPLDFDLVLEAMGLSELAEGVGFTVGFAEGMGLDAACWAGMPASRLDRRRMGWTLMLLVLVVGLLVG